MKQLSRSSSCFGKILYSKGLYMFFARLPFLYVWIFLHLSIWNLAKKGIFLASDIA